MLAQIVAAPVIPDTPDPSYPTTDGEVYDILVAPDRSIYIAGSFTEVNGVSRNSLAHILPDGTVNPDFDPGIDNPWQINGVVLSPDGSTLYVTGGFQYVLTAGGWEYCENLAAFDTATGLATDFCYSLEGHVGGIGRAITMNHDGSTVYVGGSFATAGTNLAAFDTATSTPIITNFQAGDYSGSNAVHSLALSSDGTTLYAGGRFTTVNDDFISRNHLAAFDTATGIATSFDPNISNYGYPSDGVRALVLNSDDSILYTAGYIWEVNGSTARYGVAAFDTSTGIATSFDPDITTSDDFAGVFGLALTSDDSILYATGYFNTVNGITTRNGLAAFDTATGIATSFDPNVGDYMFTNALAVGVDDATLYFGSGIDYYQDPPWPYLTCFGDCIYTPPVPPIPPEPPTPGGGSGDNLAPTGSNQPLLVALAIVVIVSTAGIALWQYQTYQPYRARRQ